MVGQRPVRILPFSIWWMSITVDRKGVTLLHCSVEKMESFIPSFVEVWSQFFLVVYYSFYAQLTSTVEKPGGDNSAFIYPSVKINIGAAYSSTTGIYNGISSYWIQQTFLYSLAIVKQLIYNFREIYCTHTGIVFLQLWFSTERWQRNSIRCAPEKWYSNWPMWGQLW